MSTTWQRVQHAIESRGVKLKREKPGQYRGNSPLRSGSDSQCFTLTIGTDEEHGTFYDHVTHDTGSLYDLADKLGVEKGDGRSQVEDSQRGYESLEDYATAHGITASYLMDAKWSITTHKERPAMQFKTATGLRYRFMDDQSPKYISEYGYTSCWYGLERAIDLANSRNLDSIVLCNGEISTLAGQYHQVPAFAMTSGEKVIADDLLNELNQKWSGRIIIALDCDDTGRKVAAEIKAQLPNSDIVDLRLSDKGDLADFCKIHTADSMNNIVRLCESQNPTDDRNPHETTINRTDEIRKQVAQELMGEVPIRERSFPFPLESMRKFGGFMRNCATGKITLIAGGTGTGKTQLLETFSDYLNTKGVNGLWFGAEWTKKEMEYRRIQRYTTSPQVTYDQIIEHLTYIGYEQDGVPPAQNFGTRLTPAQMQSWQTTRNYLDSWSGTMEYFRGHNTLEATFEDMRIAVERERRNNRLILFAVFDYVQLLKAKSWDNTVNRYEFAFECVKQFAIDMNLHVFMTTQVNKDASAANKSGKSLSAESAHYIRGDKANLFLILDRQYNPTETEDYVETNTFKLIVGKSSLGGRIPGYDEKQLWVPLVMNPKHLHFKEEDWRAYSPKVRNGATPDYLINDQKVDDIPI